MALLIGTLQALDRDSMKTSSRDFPFTHVLDAGCSTYVNPQGSWHLLREDRILGRAAAPLPRHERWGTTQRDLETDRELPVEGMERPPLFNHLFCSNMSDVLL